MSAYFSPEIEQLARAADRPEPNSNGGRCPTELSRIAEAAEDDYLAGCGAATCPVCNYCFKYCHAKDRHVHEYDEN